MGNVLLRKTKSLIKKCVEYNKLCMLYRFGDIAKTGLDRKSFSIQKKKMFHLIHKYPRDSYVWVHAKTFGEIPLRLKADNLTLSQDPLVPTVVVVVKDDLERMKMFYEHYRKLGIHQFLVLDNGSTDGSLEFTVKQKDTRVYFIDDPYYTPKKEAWVEKAITLTGMNRWYIVVDSDELIDYYGSEDHSLEELIRHMHKKGYRTLQGCTLDMYTEQPLFSVECQWNEIKSTYCWFDSSGYWIDTIKNGHGEGEILYGGPRCRALGAEVWATKCSIFYYQQETYIKTAHFNYPPHKFVELPCCFVILHYKFLKQDLKVYADRINKNIMGYGIYEKAVESGNSENKISFMYENSVKYESSASLLCLPFLETIAWEDE